MADSVQDKQAKSKSEAIDEVSEDNLERIASEIEQQDDVDSLGMSEEKVLGVQSSESLEDLLVFDAQVLASNSSGTVNIENDDLSQIIKNKCSEEPNIDFIIESEEARKSVKEQEQEQEQVANEFSENLEYEQQDSDSSSELNNAQNEKISQLESDDLSQIIKNKCLEEPNIDFITESEEVRKSVKEQEQEHEQEQDQVANEFAENLEYEQQDSNSNSALINVQNEKIFQLESELSVLKKMLAVQLDIDQRLEKSNTKFKIICVFALLIASLALLLNLWEGTLDTNIQIVSGEPQKLHTGVIKENVIPVKSQTNDVQPQSLALVTENIQPEKILVEPEDDISNNSTADNAVKVVEGDKAQIKGWVVNLNSYEQLWEADKKIEELREKGIVTEMIIVSVRGVRWYRIRITGFKTKAEADSYATTIKEILKVSHAWVSKL